MSGAWIQVSELAEAPEALESAPRRGTAAVNPKSKIANPKSAQCSASRNFSASIAAMQPEPAAVMACR